MWIKASGGLSENVFQLITSVSTHFLVVGEEFGLVDTSIAAVANQLQQELESYLGQEGKLNYILLTHAHFDHLGGVPHLRKRYPNAELVAAPQTTEFLKDKKHLAHCYQKNVSCAEAAEGEVGFSEEEWVKAFEVSRIMGDGDTLEIGDDVEIKLISTPGHTEDSVSYLVQPDSALAGGESIGSYGGRDRVTNCFLTSYDDYLESLEKLSGLDLKILGFPHGGALTGDLVPKFFMDARQAAEDFKETVKERLAQGEIVDEVYAALLADWKSQNICPEGPFAEEQTETLKAMIKAVAAV